MHRSRLPIARPCAESFDAMTGEGARRFCDACRTDVHDLSSMTREDAQALLEAHAGTRLCVRYRTDRAGRLRFRAPARWRPSLALVAAAFGLAACTGWAEPGELEVPDDDAFGDASAGDVAIPTADPEGIAPPRPDSDRPRPVDRAPEPEPTRGEVGPSIPEPDATPIVAPDVEEIELMGDIDVSTDEGCPVPPPRASDDDVQVLLGRVIPSELTAAQRSRLERRAARRSKRAGR